MLRAIINLLRGYDTKFLDIELRIFSELSNLLQPDDQIKLSKRLKNIQRISRLDGGREVLLYQFINKKPVFPAETKIFQKSGIVKIAEFEVKSDNRLTANKGFILISDGNIFSIDFRRPTEHAEIDDIISIEMKIVDEPYDEDEDLKRD
jgi:hypothetical protein